MAKIRVRKTVDRRIHPHNDLSNAAFHFKGIVDAKLAVGDRKGIAFDILAQLVFLAFAFEAQINFLGQRFVPKWKERDPFHRKVDAVFAALGVAPDRTARPYSSIEALKKLRDTLAHAKPQRKKTDEVMVIDCDTDDSSPFAELREEWYAFYEGTFYLDAYEDAEAVWNQLLAASGLTRFETTTWSEGSTKFIEHVSES